jgi:hypothetical protein
VARTKKPKKPEYKNPVFPVPPPLQDVHLVVTSDQVWNMQGNKAIGFLPMHPMYVLALTTSDDEHVKELITERPDRKGTKLGLEDYNRFSEDGNILVPPFLRVDMQTGQVQGHEGRHRAAALYRADPDALMWVAIEVLDPGGYAVYYEEPPYDPNLPSPFQRRRYLDGRDIPTVFVGEYRPVQVEVDPSLIWLIPR